jgi:hypothetical protein
MSDKPMSDKRCPVCLSDSRKYGNMRPCADAWHTEREYLGSPAQPEQGSQIPRWGSKEWPAHLSAPLAVPLPEQSDVERARVHRKELRKHDFLRSPYWSDEEAAAYARKAKAEALRDWADFARSVIANSAEVELTRWASLLIARDQSIEDGTIEAGCTSPVEG